RLRRKLRRDGMSPHVADRELLLRSLFDSVENVEKLELTLEIKPVSCFRLNGCHSESQKCFESRFGKPNEFTFGCVSRGLHSFFVTTTQARDSYVAGASEAPSPLVSAVAGEGEMRMTIHKAWNKYFFSYDFRRLKF